MKIYGSLSRIIAILFQQNGFNITLQPDSSTTYTADRAIKLPPGDAASQVLGDTSTQTVTNKTISGSSNTLTVLAGSQLSGQVPIANGGTNATTASGARTNLSAAQSGANSDITSLSGLTTPLSVGQGGTNSSTALNNNRVIVSSGGAIVEEAAITGNRALASNSSGLPVASSTTDTELGYVSGVTSAIQTQLNGKASTALSNLTVSSLAAGSLLVGSSSSAVVNLAVGTNGQTLTISAGSPAWVSPAGTTFNADWSQQSATVTISNASPGVVTYTAHGLVTGQALYLTTTGTLPNPLQPNTIYYVTAPTTNTFELSLTYGGAAINTTTNGSGTHTANVTSINVTHSFATKDVSVDMYDKTDGSTFEVDAIFRTDTNNVLLNASEIPSSSGWRVLVFKG